MKTTQFKSLIHHICFWAIFLATSTYSWADNNIKDSTEITSLIQSAQKKSFKNFGEAYKEITYAIEIANKTGVESLIFKTNRTAGLIHEENSRLEEAAVFYKTCLDIAPHLSSARQLDIYLDWAILNKKLGKYKIAKDYYIRTKDLATQVNDYEAISYAYNGLGTLQGVVGEFGEAINSYLQTADLAQRQKKPKDELVAWTNIADIYTKSNNFDLALENIKKAQLLAIKTNDSSKIADVLNSYGRILNAKNDFQEALKRHKEALMIFESIGDKRHILVSLTNMADVYVKSGDYKNAEIYFTKCFEYKDRFEYYEHPNLYLKLGNMYQKTQKNEEAITAYKKSLELANARSFKDIIQKSNRGLAEVYKEMGQYQNAYTYLETANAYGDTLFNDDKSKRLAEAQYKFDVEKGEKEIQSLRLTQNRYWLATILIFSSAVIIALVYFLSLKGKNNQLLLQKNSEIQFQNDRLEKSNEILRQFAYASAHDLKEPLRSISSFVFIIEKRYAKLLPPEASEYMNFVTSGVKRMESLLSALLEYSTVASDEQVVKQSTSLKLVVSDVKHNLHSTIIEKQAIIEADGFLPAVWISRLHLTQLFQNLVSNSLKFSNRQPIVHISGKVQDNNLIISVRDNGIGMKQEYSDKIFRLFQRLSRSPQYEGTGIGLAICKHIVDKYNGKIWFDSVEGESTTFHLSFPAKIIQNDTKMESNDINSMQPVTPH